MQGRGTRRPERAITIRVCAAHQLLPAAAADAANSCLRQHQATDASKHTGTKRTAWNLQRRRERRKRRLVGWGGVCLKGRSSGWVRASEGTLRGTKRHKKEHKRGCSKQGRVVKSHAHKNDGGEKGGGGSRPEVMRVWRRRQGTHARGTQRRSNPATTAIT